MKRQIIITLTIIAFSCFNNNIMAQVGTKKKNTTTVVKKGNNVVTKKATTTGVKKAATAVGNSKVATVSNSDNGYKCKVSKTTSGCTIVFESNSGTITNKEMKVIPCVKREFKVSYKDNSVTDVKDLDAIEYNENGTVIVKVATAAVNEVVDDSEGTKVAIKDLSFVFDYYKDKKLLSINNNECTLPANLPDGIYVMMINWNWDMPTDKVKSIYCPLTFKIEVKDGAYVRIN